MTGDDDDGGGDAPLLFLGDLNFSRERPPQQLKPSKTQCFLLSMLQTGGWRPIDLSRISEFLVYSNKHCNIATTAES